MTFEQRKAYEEKLKQMSPEEINELIQKQCLFCKIVKGDVPSYKVYEDNYVIAFLDIQPINKGHVLVVPKKHYSLITQTPDEIVSHLFVIAKRIAPVVFELMNATGILITQRNGSSAGQAVPHVHIHIIPTMKNDLATDFKERIKEVTDEEMKTISEAISEGMKRVYFKPKNKTETEQQVLQAPEGSANKPDADKKTNASEKKENKVTGIFSEEFRNKLKAKRILP